MRFAKLRSISVVPTHHEHVQYLLPDFVKGKLEPREQSEVEAHLTSCVECLRRLEEFRSLDAALEGYKTPEPPAHYFTTIVPRLRERIEKKTRTGERGLVYRVLVPLGALALLVAVLSRIPVNTGGDLRSVLGSMKSDELAEIAVEEVERQSLYLIPSTESLAAALPEESIDTKLAATILSDTDDLTYETLSDLSDQDVTIILERLGERKIL